MRLEVAPDRAAFTERAAALVAEAVAEGVAARGRARLALAGGSTPRSLHRRLARSPWREAIEWPAVELYWGDERCVPPDAPESNYGAARHDLLRHLDGEGGPAAVERVRGELGPEAAADDYERRLRQRLGDTPELDLVILGVGTDGHVASLFPGAEVPRDRWAAPARAPSGPRERVTLTPTVLDAARRLVVLAAGEAKADVVARVLAPGRSGDLHRPPAARLAPRELTWLLDRAAAGALPRSSR